MPASHWYVLFIATPFNREPKLKTAIYTLERSGAQTFPYERPESKGENDCAVDADGSRAVIITSRRSPARLTKVNPNFFGLFRGSSPHARDAQRRSTRRRADRRRAAALRHVDDLPLEILGDDVVLRCTRMLRTHLRRTRPMGRLSSEGTNRVHSVAGRGTTVCVVDICESSVRIATWFTRVMVSVAIFGHPRSPRMITSTCGTGGNRNSQ